MSNRWSIPSLALLLLALPATAKEATGKASLISFEPEPTEITLQASEAAPELGNAVAALRLDQGELERLASETGRTDFMLLGPDESQALFRDDGVFPDDRRGDAVFHGMVQVDPEELAERAEADSQNALRTRNQLVFDGRALVGETLSQPFSFKRFTSGFPAALGPPIGTLGTSTPGFTTAFQDNVLMITDPSVVADPTRTIDPCNPPPVGSPLPAWSFGRLMSDMANPGGGGPNPSTFVENWLQEWLTNQTINSFNVPARNLMNVVLNAWHAASPGTQLDLRLAPMRLMAIVPRIDLRRTTTGGGGYSGASGTNFLDAGEGRFVFAVVNSFNGCVESPWTVILEYEVPINSCNAVKQWAQDWIALNSLTIGTPAYNTALQNLTDVFAAPGAMPSKPNGSAINQVRTNENDLNSLWELREFHLQSATPSPLTQATVAESPDESFRPSAAVNSYIAAGSPSPMPLNHPVTGLPFLGGASETPLPPSGVFWDGVPSMPGPTSGRHEFSLDTCNGCHGGETDTHFVHINPAPNGPLSTAPFLSDFLVGANVTDPVDSTVRFFDDLDRREVDINDVAGMVCSAIVGISPAHALQSLESSGVLPPNPFGEHTLSTVTPNDLGLDLLLSPGLDNVH